MVIKEKELARLMKDAYRGGGYTVAVRGNGKTVICANAWAVEIDDASDIENLQLAHWTCNRQKSDKILKRHRKAEEDETISNRILPQSCDWAAYRSS